MAGGGWCDQYSYNAANQLTQIVRAGGPTTTFGYDDAGNQTTKTVGTDAYSYGFDYRNRMVAFDGPGTENDATYAFYPHHWARRGKTVAGTTTKFLYDGDNVVAEYDGSDASLVTYVTPFLDQNVALTIPAGQPDAGTYYYLQDGLGSVRNLTDASQVEQNRYDYEAFGQEQVSNVADVYNRFSFTGRRSDPESGLMHYRYRE
jgi:YD repeat-containing protein